jgi:hypothetical protein
VLEGDVDLEDQAFELVGDGDERIARRGSTSGGIVGEGLGTGVAMRNYMSRVIVRRSGR